MSFETLSGQPVEGVYTREDLPEDPAEAIGLPGEFPYTRGVYPSMYRGRLWTVRLVSGFGTAEESNERFHYLLRQGQTALSAVFDMPTLMGHDSDDPLSLGEVGRGGTAVDTVSRPGGAVRRDRAPRGVHQPRDLGSCCGDVGVLRGCGGAAGGGAGGVGGDDPDGHFEGVHRSEGVVFSD